MMCQVKLKHIKKFLKDNDKVKISMMSEAVKLLLQR